MLFRHVINDSEKGRGTSGSVYVTQKTSSVVIYNNVDKKFSRFFNIISFFYCVKTGR